MTPPRVGVISVWHETNEYSRRLAGLPQWENYELLSGEEFRDAHQDTRSVVGGFLDNLGDLAVPVFGAGAWPSGPAPADVIATLLDRLSADLASAGRLDAIALNLHGAMVAVGMPDVELEVARRIRAIVGGIPIVAVMDLHGNPSVELAAEIDVLLSYQTYPHVDMWECGRDSVKALETILAGTPLTTSIAKLPFLTCPLAQGTADGPMRAALDWIIAQGERHGLVRTSVMAGFAYQDVDRAGISVLAVSTVGDSSTAEQIVSEAAAMIRTEFEAGAFAISRPDAATAVREAIAATETPVVLADIADNIGAGSAGDGTVILGELLAQGARGAVVVIADAEVALLASSVEPGTPIDVLLGGKTDDLHGPSLPVTAIVRSAHDGRYISRGSWATGQSFEMGTTAVLDIDGVTVVVTERATPPFHREHLTSVGVEPADARILVAKGAIAWRAAYGDDARTVIEVDAPGACPIDPWTLPRRSDPVGTWPAVTPRATSHTDDR